MGNWVMPVDAGVSYAYGVANDRYESGYHTGCDFGAPAGAKVGSASGGRVVLARPASYGSAYGNYVIVDHGNGVFSLYAHLASMNVRVGERVKAGEMIGTVGSTGHSSGAHLHFEIRKGGGGMVYGSDVNPIRFLQARDAENAPITGGGARTDGGGGGGNDGGGGDPGLSKSDFGFSPEFLDQHPAIERLIDKAIDKEWSMTRFQAELKQTQWWKTHTEAQRDWQVTVTEDPAQAKEIIKDTEAQIRALATQLGVQMTNKEIKAMAEKAARNAWDSTEMQMAVGRQFRMGQGPQTGMAATTVQDLRILADEYGVPMSRKRVARWTEDVLQGKQTVEGYVDVLREQAKELYPHLADTLERGRTVRQWADPYLQTAAQMLGVNADTIRLDRGKFAQLLDPQNVQRRPDGKDKDKRPERTDGRAMTMDEWQTLIRNDQRFGWDGTSGAQQEAAQITTELARMMGALG